MKLPSKIYFNCFICKKKGLSYRNDYLRAKHHFCSNKCRMYWRNYIANPDYLPHVKKFFAKKYLDNGNPNWKGGEARWNLDKHKREKRIPKFCQHCKKKYKKYPIEIHHVDKNRWNNEQENLRYLCDSCHKNADLGKISP